MSTRVLVVVPCGKGKIWDKFPKIKATRAEEAYVGAPFKVNKAFAKKFADEWVILSAKYGFVEPTFIIPENYDVSFNHPETNPINLGGLKSQVKEKDLENFDVVIVLGGGEIITTLSPRTMMAPSFFTFSASVVSSVSSSTKLRC